jgi:NADPH:quinone reductase-like Zn-dependent oxidoreductase
MRAVTFAEYGPASVLEVTEASEPHAGPGQVRIAVKAAAVNPFDWKQRAGYAREMMPIELPFTIGMEAAGTVDEVGDGVRRARVLTDPWS